MITLPILHSLDVDGYGMYPGSESREGLHIDFLPGLTLVLGANGLGKSTLVTILYRLLTGPFDIPALVSRSQLGNASIDARVLTGRNRRVLSERVSDQAVNAIATIDFSLDGTRVIVSRHLSNLSLTGLSVAGNTLEAAEETYQTQIRTLAGTQKFGDWILLLQYLVFYFERRRSLIWDPSAQRQLLRIMCLGMDVGQDWAEREREILELDTDMRNLRAVTNRERSNLQNESALEAGEAETRTAIHEFIARCEDIGPLLDQAVEALEGYDTAYEHARLRALTSEHRRESQYRELEHAQLSAIMSHMPSASDTVKYILTQLMSNKRCLVCGSHAPEIAESMGEQITQGQCVICRSSIESDDIDEGVPAVVPNIELLVQAFEAADSELHGARSALSAARNEREESLVRARELRRELEDIGSSIESLYGRLPAESEELEERRLELRRLAARVTSMEADLVLKRDEFEQIVEAGNRTIAARANEIRAAFEHYAAQFLFEECNLSWAPVATQLGQSGQRFEFPAFGLDLGGSDFTAAVRRTGPNDVSESQREFIDLAFRMALAEVAADGAVSSLIIDAPESSLDAIFVERAATVLGEYADQDKGNRLIVTSNLVDGDLIPQLLQRSSAIEEHADRVVNLFSVAAPTAAMIELEPEYQSAVQRVLDRAGSPSQSTGSA